MITVGCCIPKQTYTKEEKYAWLYRTIRENPCDLFLTSQEMFGGHYGTVLAKRAGVSEALHITRSWLDDHIGRLALETKTAIGVGAALKHESGGATEDYLYYNKSGEMVGYHRKFALPAYDDVRSKGAGQLWPETSYSARITPVKIQEIGLTIGTVFCWEVFNLSLWPAYSFQGVNLIVHPIKFAPRGWLKLKEINGQREVIGFDQSPKSQEWLDRLIMAGRHEVFCPIAISCNTWDLGEKYKALTGHVDEILKTTDLIEVGSAPGVEQVHTFQMNPALYSEGLDNLFSAGSFKQEVGTVEGFYNLKQWTMHAKVRRLEAQLIGGTTKLDCLLKSAVETRQKPSSLKRARAHGLVK